MRLIDADALKDLLCNQCTNDIIEDECTEAGCGYSKIVDSMPTIEAEPVRYGRWENPTESKPRMFERYGHTFIQRQCTECRRWSIQVAGSITYKYCPHCSVKMRGDEDATG